LLSKILCGHLSEKILKNTKMIKIEDPPSKIEDLGYFTIVDDHNQTTFLRIPSEDEESGGE